MLRSALTNTVRLPIVLSFLAAAIPLATKAQEVSGSRDSSLELDTIVITGQKAERSLGDTDGSVTVVFPGQSDGVAGAADDLFGVIERLSNVAPFSADDIAIRGVGQSGFAFGSNYISVRGPNDMITTYVDGIPVSSNGGAFGFWDVDQIEVLRGAQSTVLGRGSVGGAVVIENADPTFTTEATGQLTVGTGGAARPSFAVSGPIVEDRLAYRIAFDRQRSPSFIENVTTGDSADLKEILTRRLKLLYIREHGAELEFSGFSRTDNIGNRYVPYFSSDPQSRKAFSNSNDRTERDATGASLRGSWPLSNMFSLESATVWVREQADLFGDFDLTAESISTGEMNEDIRTISQEIRFRYEGSHFNGFIGFYYEDFAGETSNQLTALGMELPKALIHQNVSTVALFGEGNIQISDKIDLTFGLRTENEKTTTTNANDITSKGNFSIFLPKIGLAYRFSPRTRFYGTVQRGYRAGGTGSSLVLGTVYDFSPETTWTVDLGIRHKSSDGRIRLNSNLFYTEWYDQQLPVPNPEDQLGLGDTIVDNVARSLSYGLESDIDYQATEHLHLFSSLGLLYTEFKEADESNRIYIGNRFPSAPTATVGLGGIYSFDNGIDISMSANWRNSFFPSIGNFPENEIDSRFLVDLGVGYKFPSRNVRFDLKVTNLFDTYYRNFAALDPVNVMSYQAFNPTSEGAVGPSDGRAVSLTLRSWF